jgi:hypothetical protein
MGQSSSSEPPKYDPKPESRIVDPPKLDVRVADPPKLDFRVADPLAQPPTGLALIVDGGHATTTDCPVVGALATCLREKHGCQTVIWRTQGVRNSESLKGSVEDMQEDCNVSLLPWRTHAMQ